MRYQEGGAGSDGSELGFLGSLNKAVSMSDDTKLRLFGEAAWFRNFQGTADNALVVTGSAAIEMGAATYSLAYSQQRTFVAVGSDTSEHLIDATAMCALDDNLSITREKWSIGAGYAFDRADGANKQTLGLKLSSEFGGKIPLRN